MHFADFANPVGCRKRNPGRRHRQALDWHRGFGRCHPEDVD
jgi:hypothetical protein